MNIIRRLLFLLCLTWDNMAVKEQKSDWCEIPIMFEWLNENNFRGDSNKELISEFSEGYRIGQKILEEGRRGQQPKRWEYSNLNELSSPQCVKNKLNSKYFSNNFLIILKIIIESITYTIDWLIDSNGMSTPLRLFYAKKFGNRVYCTFIFTSCVDVS